MLDEYAFGATYHHVERNLIDLSNAGTLSLARIAQDMVSWHFGLKQWLLPHLTLTPKYEQRAKENVWYPHLVRQNHSSIIFALTLTAPLLTSNSSSALAPRVISSDWKTAPTRKRLATNGDGRKLRTQQRTFDPRRYSVMAAAALVLLSARTWRKIARRLIAFLEHSWV